jgi:hypothetical protein
MRRVIQHVGILTTLIGLSLTPAAAQTRATTADLTGVVRDPAGSVVPGVTVTAIHTETNTRRTSVTDAEGRYQLLVLPPGTYDVQAELSGFKPHLRRDVTLTLGALVALDFDLTIPTVTEQVVVTAEGSLVNLERTVVASVVAQEQIAGLPINVRDFISFSVITPGAAPDRTPQQGASTTSGISFAGQRARSNNITVDGLDNNDLDTGGVRATFSQEAVREFQVLTSGYSAEFGKASAGVVNIVTKSGTNQLGGNAFGYFRHENLNAKEHFEKFDPAGNAIDREKAPYSQAQFGATLGGPLQTDRMFYFLSFERRDIEANNFVTINDTDIVSVFGTPVGTARQIFERAGFPVPVGNVAYAVASNQFLAKVDRRMRTADSLSVRFNWADGLNENIEPWGGQVAQSRGALLDNSDSMVAGSYTSVLSDRSVNEFRVQYAYRDSAVNSLDPKCSGGCDAFDEGGPTIEVSGVGSAGRQRLTPQPKTNKRFQLLDTFSILRGRHSLKAGFDYSFVGTNGALPAHFGGRYIFQPLPAIPGLLPAPITSIQALALNLPAAYVQGYGTATTDYDVGDLSLFAQDDWALASDITLKVGVRYQKQFFPNRLYDPAGIDPYEIPADNNNLAPRLAVAWNPFGNNRTSVHASYGMYFDNHITGLLGVVNLLNGAADGVRTLVGRLPSQLPIAAWRNEPSRQLPESAVGTFPSLVVVPDPELKTPVAHHTVIGFNRELRRNMSLAVNYVHIKGSDQLGSLDYNPIVPALGPGRRPEDAVINGVPTAGTSTSILQYTTFGETWYDGLTVSLERRLRDGFQYLVSYTLSKAEDNSTDFQSQFIPENTGTGRDPGNPTGLPIGFNPDTERGASVHDQRHRLVMSGLYQAPYQIQLSSIITIGSGRPYNILAGLDLNGDGDGGAFPADRARRVPGDPSTSVERNSGTLPATASVDVRASRRFVLRGRMSVDAVLDVFNLFNRTNYTEINNIFGAGAFPDSPLPAYGQFERAAPPLQVQLGGRINW